MAWLREVFVPHLCDLEYTFKVVENGYYVPRLGDFWQCDDCKAIWTVSYRSGYEGTVTVGYTRWHGPEYLDVETQNEYVQEALNTYQLLHEVEGIRTDGTS